MCAAANGKACANRTPGIPRLSRAAPQQTAGEFSQVGRRHPASSVAPRPVALRRGAHAPHTAAATHPTPKAPQAPAPDSRPRAESAPADPCGAPGARRMTMTTKPEDSGGLTPPGTPPGHLWREPRAAWTPTHGRPWREGQKDSGAPWAKRPHRQTPVPPPAWQRDGAVTIDARTLAELSLRAEADTAVTLARWCTTIPVTSVTVEPLAPVTRAPMLDTPVMPPAPREGGSRGFTAPKAWTDAAGVKHRPMPAAVMTHRWYRETAVTVMHVEAAAGRLTIPADEKAAKRLARSMIRRVVRPRLDAERRAEAAFATWQTRYVKALSEGVSDLSMLPLHPAVVALHMQRLAACNAPTETPPVFQFSEPVSRDAATGDFPEYRAFRFLLHSLAHPDARSLPSLFETWRHGMVRDIKRRDAETGEDTVAAFGREAARRFCEWCATHCVHAANPSHTCPMFAELSVRGTPRARHPKDRARAVIPEFAVYQRAKAAHEASRDAARMLQRWADSVLQECESELRALDAIGVSVDPDHAPDAATRAFVESLHSAVAAAGAVRRECHAVKETGKAEYAPNALAQCAAWHTARGEAPPHWLTAAAEWRARTEALGAARFALFTVIRKHAAEASEYTIATRPVALDAAPTVLPDGRRVIAPDAPSGYVADAIAGLKRPITEAKAPVKREKPPRAPESPVRGRIVPVVAPVIPNDVAARLARCTPERVTVLSTRGGAAIGAAPPDPTRTREWRPETTPAAPWSPVHHALSPHGSPDAPPPAPDPAGATDNGPTRGY